MAEGDSSSARTAPGEHPNNELLTLTSSPRIQTEGNEEPSSPHEDRLIDKFRGVVRKELEQNRNKGKNKGKKKSKCGAYRKNDIVVPFKDFKKCGATEFTGVIDPVVAQLWIENTEKVFRIAHVAKNDETVYASALLTKHALTWWNNTYKSLSVEERDNMPWEMFKVRFLEQYCPRDMRKRLEVEF